MAIWNKDLFDQIYKLPGWQWGVRDVPRVPLFHYNWFAAKPITEAIVSKYISMPGFAQVSDVAIVGGGYGWTAEVLADYGVNAISIDTSEYIQTTKNVSEEQELRDTLITTGWDPDNLPVFIGPDWNTPVNPWDYWLRQDGVRTSKQVIAEDLASNSSRRAVRTALGTNPDAIISEYALDSQDTEADALTLINRIQSLRPNPACAVIHLVADSHGLPQFVDKTALEWRTFLNQNGFTDHYVVDPRGVVVTGA